MTHLAAAEGRGPVEAECPDDPTNTKGAAQGQKFVDLTAATEDGTFFALEHTLIESYPLQMEEWRQIEKNVLPAVVKLDGRLPPDRAYRLSFEAGAEMATTEARVDAKGLCDWVCEVAPTLLPGAPTTAPAHQTPAPVGTAISVTLSAWAPSSVEIGGSLRVFRHGFEQEGTSRDQRTKRIRKALEDKLPKLLEHQGATTILVLEDEDLATSNISDVWVSLQDASAGLELSDRIVVLETGGGMEIATTVYVDGLWLEDFCDHRFRLPRI